MENVKKSKGRQKVELKFIENQENRLVTFSKRRDGINKKASELCTLTGINIALLVTSLSGKTYSFSHPSVDSVASRLLHQTLLPNGILEPYQDIHIMELNKEMEDVSNKVKVEEQRRNTLKLMKEGRGKNVWEEPTKDLNDKEAQMVIKQLSKMQSSLMKIMNKKYRSGKASHALKASAARANQK